MRGHRGVLCDRSERRILARTRHVVGAERGGRRRSAGDDDHGRDAPARGHLARAGPNTPPAPRRHLHPCRHLPHPRPRRHPLPRRYRRHPTRAVRGRQHRGRGTRADAGPADAAHETAPADATDNTNAEADAAAEASVTSKDDAPSPPEAGEEVHHDTPPTEDDDDVHTQDVTPEEPGNFGPLRLTP